MSTEFGHGSGPGFDPVRAEFGDIGLHPASSEVLDQIMDHMREVSKFAHRHPMAELAVFGGDKLILIKKHLEPQSTNEYGEVREYPSGEITVFDGSFDKEIESYTLWQNGRVRHSLAADLFIELIEDQEAEFTLADLRFDSEDRDVLDSDSSDELAGHLLTLLDEDAPISYRPGALIKHVFDVAAAKGVRTQEIGEVLIARGIGPDFFGYGVKNAEIWFDVFERDGSLAELESAVKLRFTIKMENHIGVEEIDSVTVHENGSIDYSYDNMDVPRSKAGGTQAQKVATRRENKRWKEISQQAGLSFMTQEQAERVANQLRIIVPRIKWEVAYPSRFGLE